MHDLEAAGDVLAAGVRDLGSNLVAIPAGYGIGAWLGTLIALASGADRDTRADARDVLGTIGGALGVVWLLIAFIVG